MNKIRWFTDPELVEPQARDQVMQTASMPFVQGLAVMPDVHFGKGSTVGTVVATKGAIMPACVGVDIGCGMIAVRTFLHPDQIREKLTKMRESIERAVPTGIGERGMNSLLRRTWELDTTAARITELESLAMKLFGTHDHMDRRSKDWKRQLGSLGGGNHFIEVCTALPATPEGMNLIAEEVWVILHSGSRGVGNKTGTFWTNVAKSLVKGYYIDLPNPDLAYLTEGSPEFDQYLLELQWCQEFARLNREEMMDRVLREISYVGGNECGCNWCGTVFPLGLGLEKGIEVERINCHHNYIAREHHEGEDLLITRKGAISASVGTRGLIPGSMGACSYIVTGRGNPESYESAPHGAGRCMSRGAARKQFTVETVRQEMEALHIEARVREAIVDEAPGAYKDIEMVMFDARELVTAEYRLKQLISVKGD